MGTAFRAASLAVLLMAASISYASADGAEAKTWQGFYLGAGIGATGGSLPISYSDGTHWDGPGVVGVSASGFLGYDFQTSSNWVFGLEVRGTWTDLNNTDFDGTVNAKIDWMAAIDGRVGYLLDSSTLLYMKAGAAFIDLNIPSTAYIAPGTGAKTLTALQVGVGGETAIAPHWSLRAEALYNGAGESYDAFGFGFGFHIKPELVTSEIALAYRLDEASAPSDAGASEERAHGGLYLGAALGAAASATREEYFGGPLTGVAWDGFGDTNVTGSVFAGWDCQFSPNWVGGFELSASRLELDNLDNGFPFHWGTVHWSGSLDARVGYLIGGSLFYGKAGWALINFELPVSSWGAFGTGAGTKTLNGYEVGAGLEMALAPHWTARVEGDYTAATEGLDFFTAGPTQGHGFKPEIVSGKLGLAYRL